MKIEVTENGHIKLKEVFNSIVFEAESGEKLLVCMRDDAFEIAVLDKESKPHPDEIFKSNERFKWYIASSKEVIAL